jgi:hypothetical protein
MNELEEYGVPDAPESLTQYLSGRRRLRRKAFWLDKNSWLAFLAFFVIVGGFATFARIIEPPSPCTTPVLHRADCDAALARQKEAEDRQMEDWAENQ